MIGLLRSCLLVTWLRCPVMSTDDGDRLRDLIPRMDRARAEHADALRAREAARVRLQVETTGGVVPCAYVPLTGPVPDGLGHGERFTHWAVSMSPELAQALLDRYTDGARPLSVEHVEVWMGVIRSALDDPEFTAIHDEVHVGRSGETISGQHLLHAVIRSGLSVPVDVVHNSERAWP